MKALILNSGMGSRMGKITAEQPKCMTQISKDETILSRQLSLLKIVGIEEVIITTGYCDKVLIDYCNQLKLDIQVTFVKNPQYEKTNYIYSIYCAKEYLNDDIILMHGDLVFEVSVLRDILNCKKSCMKVSSTIPPSKKDFKAVVHNGYVQKVGVDIFVDSMEAQALYKLNKHDWMVWVEKICEYCESGKVKCYAEDALNEIAIECNLWAYDVKNRLCSEIDDVKDLDMVTERLKDIEKKTVYMCFSTDMVHSGHIEIIKKAAEIGKLTVGVLTDEAVMSYKRYPLLPFAERKAMFENIKGVDKVVEQRTLSYKENLEELKPDYVVHGDDWQAGIQKPIRDEVCSILASYGGQLVEYPYSKDKKYEELDKRANEELSIPDIRRKRLRKILDIKGFVTVIEAHSGITGLIAENTKVTDERGETRQFDAMWCSSLCDSTLRGKPDIELVDLTSRLKTIDEIMEVTTKPFIFDGDTGGLTEHFVYTVRTLERMGISMIIIEDKKGLKRNSLFGTEVQQTQASVDEFCEKIRAGKRAQKTKEFMICSRIESLILEKGMEDALGRAFSYVEAGSDAIMIHSRKKSPSEIFEFVKQFREKDKLTPIVVVPTSFSEVTEEEFKKRGVNIVIYANQLTRTAFPAMQNAAVQILKHHRAKECDDICMPFKDIIRLIPSEE